MLRKYKQATGHAQLYKAYPAPANLWHQTQYRPAEVYMEVFHAIDTV